MRLAQKIPLHLASLSLFAGFAACSSTPSAPAPVGDAAADVATAADVAALTDSSVVPGTDAATADTPAASDAAAITPEAAALVTELSANSWASQNRSRNLMMYGCAGAAAPRDCLADRPLVGDDTIGTNASNVPGARLRVLFTAMNRSTYWTRSSADGRFVARGVALRDLVRDVELTAQGAMYDPAFFPDNSGFSYQPGGRLCPMSMLTAGEPTTLAVTGAMTQCSGGNIGLYQHLAVSLGGDDYWASAAGTAAWDDGGRAVTLTETRRNEAWTARAQVQLSLMANTGSGYRFVANRNVTTPFQGDAVISPSSRAIITRYVDEAGAYQGYVLHRLNATQTNGAITATVDEVARYQTVGAKPSWSYDERWVVYHHYVGGGPAADADAQDMGFADSQDEGFAPYRMNGSANIYLLNLTTGQRIRVTTMRPGQYALFPHFRSDGWIYFLVRTLRENREHVIASDAAFVLR